MKTAPLSAFSNGDSSALTAGADSEGAALQSEAPEVAPPDKCAMPSARARNIRLEAAVAHAEIGVMLVSYGHDENGVATATLGFVNPAFERITGYLSNEVVGRSPRFLQGENTDAETANALRAAIAAARPLDITILNYRKDGTPFWNALQIAPVRDSKGDVTGWIAFVRDASARIEAETALRRSQANLAGAQKLAHLGSWMLDWNVTSSGPPLLVWSDEVFRILGLEVGSVTPSRAIYQAHIHAEDRERVLALQARFERQEGEFDAEFDAEYRLVRPGGEERWVRDSAVLERDASGAPRRATGIVVDITEQRTTERALVESQKRLHAVIDAVPMLIWAIDCDGIFTLSQGRALDTLGLEQGETIGQSLFALYDEDSPIGQMARRALGGEAGQEILELPGCAFEVHYSPSRDETGAIDGAMGVSYEVTESERAKRELEQSETRFNHIVANAPGMVYRSRRDLNGHLDFLFVSEGCRAIYGLDADFIRREPRFVLQLTHPDDAESFMQSILDSERDLSNWEWEGRIVRHSDGAVLWVRGQSRPARLEDGSTVWDGLLMDVTQTRLAQNEILKSRRALDEAQTLAHIGSFEWNLQSGEISWSNELFRIFGLERDIFTPTLEALFQLIVPSERELVRGRAVQAVQTASAESMIIPITRADGQIRWLQTHTRAEAGEAGRSILIVGSAQDITENIEAERALRESEQRYALAAQGANDGLWDWNLETNRIYFSPRWKMMIGYAVDEIGDEPRQWLERVHPDDIEGLNAALAAHLAGESHHFECEYRLQGADGAYRWMLCRALAVPGATGTEATGTEATGTEANGTEFAGAAQRIAGSQTDITKSKVAEAALSRDAFFDKLTGLPNRALFLDRLEKTLARARRNPDYAFATLFLDIDHFKRINDTLGHVPGDQLLVEAATRFASCLRPGDTVARLGGDEFALLVDDIRDDGDVPSVAGRIQKELERPFLLEGKEIFVTVSIGMAPYRGGEETSDDLLRNADSAMYRAKALGRARSEIFDVAMHHRALNLLELETDLWRAIERNQLRLHYQPIVCLESGQIGGYEALVRWQHPTRGLVSPADFIPIAEENGFIAPLGWWVLETACRQAKAWQDARAARFPGARAHFMAVNFSSKQFSQPDMVEQVRHIIAATGADPLQLTLEITESVIMEHTESANAMLRGLKAMEIHLSMDDFGTGYSSLSYLHRFPLDTLKIDRSFISQMRPGARQGQIVNTIMALAQGLEMKVVAEGVETAEQLQALRDMNCGWAQGFLFSKPLPAGQIEVLWETAPHW